MNEQKPAYNKPSIELIAMDAEGSLLLTASGETVTVSGGAKKPSSFGGSGGGTSHTISNRRSR